ncbi:thioesterase family protein [Parasphaerochaeta coccoides]|uniref:Thioesterase superfamily protein n=1 Tax=Parasphaerochaeta coccoides (strain ATCC BAA-1237 / DSM 17374 / SPN1) TaxID=760011 RepID=F4GJM3_PARC1|nr:thioesterase family protein [Parasphaerochaeta coccoides]AEC02770.1 thioesterase superfamily protein [Parasphaerochaeta coccoides DSM 17374]
MTLGIGALEIGASRTLVVRVDGTNMATIYDDRLLEVFATPQMIAFMELSASSLLEDYMEEGQASVGAGVDIRHTSATPEGMDVTITATVTGIDRRRVDFAVEARDACGQVGSGVHTRFIVDREAFMKKTMEKTKEKTQDLMMEQKV